MLSHQDALNVILSHNCPNGNEADPDPLVYSWVLEGHCHIIRIRAKLVESNPDHPDRNQRFKYDILSVCVSSE